MGPNDPLSLSASSRRGLSAILVAVAVAAAAGLWALDRETQLQDAAFVRQLAKTDARLITEVLTSRYDRVRELAARDVVKALLRQPERGDAQQWAEKTRRQLTQDGGIILLDAGGRALGSAGGPALVPDAIAAVSRRAIGRQSARPSVDWVNILEDRLGMIVPVVDAATKKPSGFVFATFSLGPLRAALQGLADRGQQLVLRDADGIVIAMAEKSTSRVRTVRAAAAVAGSDWQLELAQPARRHYAAYLIVTGAIAIVALAAIVLSTLNAQMLRTATKEIKHLAAFLDQLGSGPIAIQPPAMTLQETRELLPAIQRVSAALHKKQKQITEFSLTDQLTRLPNQFYFFEQLRHAYELVRRGANICILALEIDDFQKANDVLGREGADQILQMLGDTLRAQTRKSDFAARLGLCDFATIFYNAKGELMRPRLEQIQREFDEHQEKAALGTLRCTLSCGLISVDTITDKRAEDSLGRAEQALRAAKAGGGNRVKIEIAPIAANATHDGDDEAANKSR